MIIFLDIDGVLNDFSSMVNPICVGNLNYLILKTNANIVLSSSWRLAYPMEEMNNIFSEWKVIKHPIDKTPYLAAPRAMEIKKWMISNMKISESFVILDDQDIFSYGNTKVEDRLLKKNFVKTNSLKGLTEDDVRLAISILNDGSDDLN